MLTNTVDYHSHLPPYRSLLNPTSKYDYKLHTYIPIPPNEIYSPPPQPVQFKMKYKSLLNDVNRKISMKFTSGNGNGNMVVKILFKDLPIEIKYYIFSLLEFNDLKNCLLVNKDFYKISKQYLYRDLKFDSSFRLSQFITLLRINPNLGKLVNSIDLSNLKPCNYEVSTTTDTETTDDEEGNGNSSGGDKDIDSIRAGWRDWKFLKNPLYTNNLTRIQSNNNYSTLSNNTSLSNDLKKKRFKINFLKRRKHSHHSHPLLHHHQHHHHHPHSHGHNHGINNGVHPLINKFLINYSNTRDVPIGHILHLLNYCPNLIDINLSSVQLSTDYEISPNFIYKFITFDIIHNYPKNLSWILNDIDDNLLIYNIKLTEIDDNLSLYSNHSHEGVTGMKYNSLLAPTSYFHGNVHGSGKLYLSDLSLKSINNNYLKKLNQSDILNSIIKIHSQNYFFKYLNLSSMIWLNQKLVKIFLSKFLIRKYAISDTRDLEGLRGKLLGKDLVVDFSDSGMIKNLPWAGKIDLKKLEGVDVVFDIFNDLLVSFDARLVIENRVRRGRMAENYLS